MPYASFIMMCILGLQLLALYLTIFLHKQMLAIGLVMASLLLSAVIVILSRKHKQLAISDERQNEELFNTLTTLFNHINQRHYQLHANLEKLLATEDLTNKQQIQSYTILRQLHHEQQQLSALVNHESSDLNTNIANKMKSNLAVLLKQAQLQNQDLLRWRQEEQNWLDDRASQLTSLQGLLEHSSKQADELRLMALNLNIEATKLGVSASGFTRVANEISRLVRVSDKDKQHFLAQIAELSHNMSNRRKRLTESLDEAFNASDFELDVKQLLDDSANNDISSTELASNSQTLATTIELAIKHQNLVAKHLALQTEEFTEIDMGFKAIKEYFIECMINLDELKQGLITTEQFQQNLNKMNKMLAELYDTEKEIHLINDVIK